MQTGIPVARIELLDDVQMDACIRYSKLEGLPGAADAASSSSTAAEAGVREQSATMQAISDEFGGSAFQWATLAEDRTRLWKARHAAYYADAGAQARDDGHSRPTRACPFPRLGRLHTGNQGRHREERPDRHRSSATSATAIFIWSCCYEPGDAGQRERADSAGASGQHARDRAWAAPAPASTASAGTSSTCWRRNTARRSI